jgi:plasmid maintenance system antidote protein VapI
MLLREILERPGVTQKTFAAHTGWTWARLTEVINARRQVSTDSGYA